MTEWRKVGESPRPMMARAAAEVQPLAQVVGDIPDVHVISVRERRVTVDYPTIIQNNVNTDTIELDLDGEWDGMSVVLVLGPCGGATELAWHGEPLTLPSALAEDTGGIDVSVVGYSADGDTRLVTVAAPSLLNVIKSGCTVGEAPGDETPDLIGQLVAAGDAANKAAQSANAAATSANKAAGAANTAASAANTAAGKANDAATKATDAATKATDAAGDATRAAQSANAAAEAAGAAAEAARGNVLKGTLGPAPVLSADDAYATKPRRLTVYGETRQNLWVNPSGTSNGVTVTSNADGSVTVSGTASAKYATVSINTYILKPSTTYYLSIDKNVTPASAYFYVLENAASGNVAHYLGGNGTGTANSFTTKSDISSAIFAFCVNNIGGTPSGTYRVMLNEGSEAQPWCPPGLNSVGDGGSVKIVTAGKNLIATPTTQQVSGYNGPYTYTMDADGWISCDKADKRAWSYDTANVFATLPAGTYTAYIQSTEAKGSFRVYASDGTQLFTLSLTSQTTMHGSFTVDQTTKIGIMYKPPSEMSKIRCQLELGSTATAYEPPNVTTTPIDLQGHTLNSLPDGTCDELTIDATGAVTLTKRVGAKVLPSDAASWKKDVSGAALRYSTGISPEATDPYVPGSVVSDAVPYRRQWDHSYTGTHIIAVAGAAYASVGTDETAQDIADVCGGKKLLYTLAEPQTIPLTPVTLPTLPSPNITVYHDSDVPSDITLEYERDVTIAFEQLAKQVAGTASAVAVREASTIEEE